VADDPGLQRQALVGGAAGAEPFCRHVAGDVAQAMGA
jgi:hypothetical protein